MKKYNVYVNLSGWERYEVEAEDEQEASDKVLSGQYKVLETDINQEGIGNIEEIK